MWEKSLCSKQSLLNPWRTKLKEPVLLFNEIYKYKAMQGVLRVLTGDSVCWAKGISTLKKISNCCNQNEKAQKNIKNGKMVQLALCYLVKKETKQSDIQFRYI
jgi:hypothetical protein